MLPFWPPAATTVVRVHLRQSLGQISQHRPEKHLEGLANTNLGVGRARVFPHDVQRVLQLAALRAVITMVARFATHTV